MRLFLGISSVALGGIIACGRAWDDGIDVRMAEPRDPGSAPSFHNPPGETPPPPTLPPPVRSEGPRAALPIAEPAETETETEPAETETEPIAASNPPLTETEPLTPLDPAPATPQAPPRAPEGPQFEPHFSRVQELVADPHRERLYAITSSTATDHPNAVLALDAQSGALVDLISYGASPTHLAIAGDGSTLWVALASEEGSIQPIALDDDRLVPGDELPLRLAEDGTGVEDLLVLPGTTSSLAVCYRRRGIKSVQAIALLDDGAPRPVQAPATGRFCRLTNGPLGHLFGILGDPIGLGGEYEQLHDLAITSDGLIETAYPDLDWQSGADLTYQGGYLFSSLGDVVDARDPAAPALGSTIAGAGLVLPDLERSRVWVLETMASPELLELRTLEFPSLASVETRIAGVEVLPRSHFVRTAQGTLAFIGDPAPGGVVDVRVTSGSIYLLPLPTEG